MHGTKLRRKHFLGGRTFLPVCFWFLPCCSAVLGMAWTVRYCALRRNPSPTTLLTRSVNSSFPSSWVMTLSPFLNMQRETQVRCSNVSNQLQFPAHLVRIYSKHSASAAAEAGMWIFKCNRNYISRPAALSCIADVIVINDLPHSELHCSLHDGTSQYPLWDTASVMPWNFYYILIWISDL